MIKLNQTSKNLAKSELRLCIIIWSHLNNYHKIAKLCNINVNTGYIQKQRISSKFYLESLYELDYFYIQPVFMKSVYSTTWKKGLKRSIQGRTSVFILADSNLPYKYLEEVERQCKGDLPVYSFSYRRGRENQDS